MLFYVVVHSFSLPTAAHALLLTVVALLREVDNGYPAVSISLAVSPGTLPPVQD